jgi:hypothetical protein
MSPNIAMLFTFAFVQLPLFTLTPHRPPLRWSGHGGTELFCRFAQGLSVPNIQVVRADIGPSSGAGGGVIRSQTFLSSPTGHSPPHMHISESLWCIDCGVLLHCSPCSRSQSCMSRVIHCLLIPRDIVDHSLAVAFTLSCLHIFDQCLLECVMQQ